MNEPAESLARGRLAALFRRHNLRAIVDAAVEGRLGRVTADDADQPTVARLSLGCYEVLGGDASRPMARQLVAEVAPRQEVVYGNDPAWRRLILDVLGERVVDRPMTIFDASRLDPDRLAQVEASCPAGFALRRMDAPLARELDAELQPHAMQVFQTPEHFEQDGLGYAVVAADGSLACAATSYTVSSRHLEVAIATRVAHRGHGLAAVASAALLRASLGHGMVPAWSASNPVSKRLAERLGYVPAEECEVLYLA